MNYRQSYAAQKRDRRTAGIVWICRDYWCGNSEVADFLSTKYCQGQPVN
jgi:hypothetical protein